MEQIARLRELAIQNDRYKEEEQQLLKNKRQQIEYKELNHTEEKTELGSSMYMGIFVVTEVILMIVVNKVLGFLLTLMANDGMTFNQFVKNGGFGYRNIHLPWFIGAILALPLALLLTVLVKKILKGKDNRVNRDRMQRNETNARENQNIKAQNDLIQEQNHNLEQQIEQIHKKMQELEACLQSEFVQYPAEYLTLPVVDYIERELQSGLAKSINQAIVHYEAGINVTKQ